MHQHIDNQDKHKSMSVTTPVIESKEINCASCKKIIKHCPPYPENEQLCEECLALLRRID